MNNKPILIIEVKLKGEIYSRVYSIKDFKHIVDLFNDIHGETGMKVEIMEIRERKV